MLSRLIVTVFPLPEVEILVPPDIVIESLFVVALAVPLSVLKSLKISKLDIVVFILLILGVIVLFISFSTSVRRVSIFSLICCSSSSSFVLMLLLISFLRLFTAVVLLEISLFKPFSSFPRAALIVSDDVNALEELG